jgi:hypothetical protein
MPFLIKFRILHENDKNEAVAEFFIAMSWERVGKHQLAQRALDRGVRSLDHLPKGDEILLRSNTPVDWILCQAVRREAEELINGKGPATQPAAVTNER